MLDNIILFSIKNKLIIGVLTFALIVWGCWSATKLPIDAVPDITNNQVQVITLSPSLASQEVERLITFPIEQTMAVIPKIQEVRSISRFGLSVVTVVFHDDVDIYWARQQVNEKLGEAVNLIPPGIGTPEMAPISSGLGEVYQYVVHPKKGFEEKFDARELRTIQDWYVRRQLLGTPGIAEVNSFGGLMKQYEVAFNPDRLRSYGLGISDIFSALERNNKNTGGSYIDKKPNAYFIRSEGLINSIQDIENIVLKKTEGGLPVLISDVATVQIGQANRYGALTRNNTGEAVGGIVMMLKGENSSTVVERVKERITEIQKTLPEGVVIEPFLDRSELVGRAIKTVEKNLVEGALIVIFVLVLFLGNLRAGLVVASVIPLSMLFALALMNLFGVSGNLMSLGAIDFGLIVDGAVIIVEATLHHIAGQGYSHRLSKKEMDDEVFAAASKIRSAAAFGEIIILIVYLPILALVGIEGKMFKPMAQTVSFAILGAFILSLTYVPMASALFLSKDVQHKRNISDRIMDFFTRWYRPLLLHAIRFKALTVSLAVGFLALSIFLFLRMGGEFIPTLEEGDFAVETRLLTGSSLSETIDKVTKASDILIKQFPEVKEVIGKIGAAEIPTDPMPMEACDITILLKPKEEWTSAESREELANKMQEALENVPGVNFGFSQPIQLRFNELISGVRQDVGIKIFGEDLDQLARLAQQVGGIVGTVEGAKDLYVEKVGGLPQIVVSADRNKLAQFGLDIETINTAVNTSFAGQSAGLVYEGEKRFDLVVRLNKQSREGIEDVRQLFITTADGRQIPLEQLASVELKIGPNQVQREDAKRRIIVGFNVRGRDIASVVKEIQEKIASKVKLPTGYFVTYGGQFKNLEEATARLSVAVPVSLALIFVLLFFTFHSIKQSLLIFTAIPMAAIGGVFALLIRGMPFSISAGVGFIALFGVAVLNGIVLIAEFNRLRKEGWTDIDKIILEGTTTRLRPVLMTACVASLGFLPMAFATSAGGEVQRPLATVVIGGLVTSTLLTLLVLPCLYIYFEKIKVKPSAALSLAVVCLSMLPFVGQAQAPKALSLDQALQSSNTQNNLIKSAQLQVVYNQNLKGTATDLGKTSAMLMYGQYNSYYNDNNLTISQSIPFPTVMHRQSRLYSEVTKSAEYNVKVTQNELYYKVKTAYYNLLLSKSRKKLLERLDSLNTNFLKAADARFRTGASNTLERATAQSQLYEIRNQMAQNESDILIYQTQLQALLNSNDPITSEATELQKRELVFPNDTLAIQSNPALKHLQQQITVANVNKRLERSRLLPDFTLGYFNQSLYGTINYSDPSMVASTGKRFQGVMVGLNFPIWIKPQLSRIRANESFEKAARANYQAYQRTLQGDYEGAYQQYLKYKNSLEFYESNALPTAKVIEQSAWKNYQTGNIGYLEFSQGLNRAIAIQQNHLDILNQYNQSIIYIEYLIGNN